MLLYATTADVTTWVGEDPDVDVTPMIRKASILVGNACRNDLYDVDGAGKPSNPDLVEAMRDAVCAQVEFWVAAGVNPAKGAGSLALVKTEMTVDGATVKYDTTGVVAAAQEAAASIDSLTGDALAVLRAAGLASGLV
ncbi:head-tail connector protein [Gordonia amicalis]|uniref:Uncharacterized protein n=1 Tax=Gordonia amicalis TaxID=89053 RepID=A0ABU4DJT0_9ACTN|nr:hypothetical protein [Gordonia amicalis]MDV6309910.1 hypothetical protein [Gordonia amicalis]